MKRSVQVLGLAGLITSTYQGWTWYQSSQHVDHSLTSLAIPPPLQASPSLYRSEFGPLPPSPVLELFLRTLIDYANSSAGRFIRDVCCATIATLQDLTSPQFVFVLLIITAAACAVFVVWRIIKLLYTAYQLWSLYHRFWSYYKSMRVTRAYQSYCRIIVWTATFPGSRSRWNICVFAVCLLWEYWPWKSVLSPKAEGDLELQSIIAQLNDHKSKLENANSELQHENDDFRRREAESVRCADSLRRKQLQEQWKQREATRKRHKEELDRHIRLLHKLRAEVSELGDELRASRRRERIVLMALRREQSIDENHVQQFYGAAGLSETSSCMSSTKTETATSEEDQSSSSSLEDSEEHLGRKRGEP